MGQLSQPEAGNESQQGAIGDGPRVIRWLRFAAKGKGDWLCLRSASKVVSAIPGGHQRQRQQQHEWQACDQILGQPGGRQLHGPGAQPVG